MSRPNDRIIQSIKAHAATPEEAEVAIKKYLNDIGRWDELEKYTARETRTNHFTPKNESNRTTMCCKSYRDDLEGDD